MTCRRSRATTQPNNAPRPFVQISSKMLRIFPVFFFVAHADLNPPVPVRPLFLAQVGGDYNFLLSVTRNEFLRTAREQVARCISVASDALASASGAPDVKDSSRRRSFQTEAASASSLAFEAHSLKGAASTIRADAIADACSRLERAARAVMKARGLGDGSEGDGAFFSRGDAETLASLANEIGTELHAFERDFERLASVRAFDPARACEAHGVERLAGALRRARRDAETALADVAEGTRERRTRSAALAAESAQAVGALDLRDAAMALLRESEEALSGDGDGGGDKRPSPSLVRAFRDAFEAFEEDAEAFASDEQKSDKEPTLDAARTQRAPAPAPPVGELSEANLRAHDHLSSNVLVGRRLPPCDFAALTRDFSGDERFALAVLGGFVAELEAAARRAGPSPEQQPPSDHASSPEGEPGDHPGEEMDLVAKRVAESAASLHAHAARSAAQRLARFPRSAEAAAEVRRAARELRRFADGVAGSRRFDALDASVGGAGSAPSNPPRDRSQAVPRRSRDGGSSTRREDSAFDAGYASRNKQTVLFERCSTDKTHSGLRGSADSDQSRSRSRADSSFEGSSPHRVVSSTFGSAEGMSTAMSSSLYTASNANRAGPTDGSSTFGSASKKSSSSDGSSLSRSRHSRGRALRARSNARRPSSRTSLESEASSVGSLGSGSGLSDGAAAALAALPPRTRLRELLQFQLPGDEDDHDDFSKVGREGLGQRSEKSGRSETGRRGRDGRAFVALEETFETLSSHRPKKNSNSSDETGGGVVPPAVDVRDALRRADGHWDFAVGRVARYAELAERQVRVLSLVVGLAPARSREGSGGEGLPRANTPGVSSSSARDALRQVRSVAEGASVCSAPRLVAALAALERALERVEGERKAAESYGESFGHSAFSASRTRAPLVADAAVASATSATRLAVSEYARAARVLASLRALAPDCAASAETLAKDPDAALAPSKALASSMFHAHVVSAEALAFAERAFGPAAVALTSARDADGFDGFDECHEDDGTLENAASSGKGAPRKVVEKDLAANVRDRLLAAAASLGSCERQAKRAGAREGVRAAVANVRACVHAVTDELGLLKPSHDANAIDPPEGEGGGVEGSANATSRVGSSPRLFRRDWHVAGRVASCFVGDEHRRVVAASVALRRATELVAAEYAALDSSDPPAFPPEQTRRLLGEWADRGGPRTRQRASLEAERETEGVKAIVGGAGTPSGASRVEGGEQRAGVRARAFGLADAFVVFVAVAAALRVVVVLANVGVAA